MAKTKKKKSAIKKQKGSVLIIMLLLIVAGSFMFVNGVLPGKSKTITDDILTSIPVLDSPDGEKKNLQLKTLKFKDCSNSVTLDLLLDSSGSMGRMTPSGQSKLFRLKEAVLSMTNNLSDNSVIGIQSFYTDNIQEIVPISYYKDIKGIIRPRIEDLSPGSQTPTKDALVFSFGKLQEAIPKFPDRKFNFILISDGAPVPGRGRTGNQDPRDHTPNPADQIKSLGVNVYTLGIYDSVQAIDPELSELLKSIASSPQNYFEAGDADQTKLLLQQISEKICSEAQKN